MKKMLHVIPHSHWDREWYMPFEKHRTHLVDLFDDLIATMEENPDYTYYHMDGQYVPIEDYLEIRPYMRDRLVKLIRDGRIKIGPWYVLQDEYLTSGEANVRNMLYGIRLCRELGAEPVHCGYFPDAFGNVSQAPQIVRGFGFDNAVFGRGVCDVGYSDNTDGRATVTSELIWRAPDGSEVIGVLMANWYCNAMELPDDPDRLRDRIKRITESAQRVALTDHLLGMNGCDHQPVQTNLHEIIKLANEVQNEIEVKQSNFTDYVAELRPYKDRFPVYEGEINGQLSSGSCPLICTASAHVDIKQDNYRTEHLLERIAEPISAIAMINGGIYKQDLLRYAWRKLMQNHPHDSICACSCDEVYDEMKVRFAKSAACGEQIRDDSLEYMARVINTENVDGDKAILLFSLDPNVSRVTVKANVDFAPEEKVESIAVFDENGKEVPARYTLKRNQFTYVLPRHKFREAKYVDRFEVELSADLCGVGYRTLSVRKQSPSLSTSVIYGDCRMENEYLSVTINSNGTLDLTDKRSGRSYLGQNLFEDTQDRGNLYNYVQSEGDVARTNGNVKADISLFEVTPMSVTYKAEIPLGIDADITTYVTLRDGIARVDIRTAVTNRAEDHRLRALFPTDISTKHVYAEGQFDVVKRDIMPAPVWKNPCYAQRLQAFIELKDDSNRDSLLIATRGLCEYEILRDGRNTAAITLLRAIGDIGDWGVFPNPKGQKIGTYELEYSLIPFNTADEAAAFGLAYSFAYPCALAIGTDKHSGALPCHGEYISLNSEYIRMSAMKKAEDTDGVIVRLFNTHTERVALTATISDQFSSATLTDLDEKPVEPLSPSDGRLMLDIPAKKIVTLLLK